MKKTLLFLIAATAMMMTGCSNDDFGGATQGMTLNATVEQPASRATMTEETDGNYQFSFTDNDKISVGNTTPTSDYYIFTKSGEKFSCATAKPAVSDVDWYAYFPSTPVSLADQKGDLEGVANYYACAGKTAQATTGTNGLAISLTPQVAILRIVKVDGNSTTCDFNVKTSDGKWVSGLTAKNNEAGFDVVTSETKVTLLRASEPGTYYIAVPAGVQITIYNGDTKFKATKAAGLTAGMYYTLTTGPVKGSADAKGISKPVEWVQLWAGGPKFATQNVATPMTFADATKTGADYVWGENWRTPTKEEMTLVNATFDGTYYSITPLHTTCHIAEESGKVGLRYTGIMPGYTNQSIFLPFVGNKDYLHGNYWTSISENDTYGTSLNVIGGNSDNGDIFIVYYFDPKAYTTPGTTCFVRPVLAE